MVLGLAYAVSVLGFVWIALSMDTHWQQVRGRGSVASHGGVLALRVMGALALAGSLVLCFAVDNASMASLIWPMTLAAAVPTVAFLLAWRPRWLALPVIWVPRSDSTPKALGAKASGDA